MERKTIIASNIESVEKEAALDKACKKLLANKIILAWVMKSCLQEYREFDVKEIADNYIEGTPQISQVSVNPDEKNWKEDEEQIRGANTEDVSLYEGIVRYDIRFFAILPVRKEVVKLIINVEMQNTFYPGYPLIKRAIYYCGRMISSQYGTEFTNSHYEKIKKVNSIWICMDPPKKRQNSITKYEFCEENLAGKVKEEKKNYDLMNIIMIGLGETEDKNCTGLLRLLGVLFSTKKETEEKKQILQDEFGIVMTRTLEKEVTDMGVFSEFFKKRGLEEGREEGRELGRRENLFHSIECLMETMNLSMDEAMKVLKVSDTEKSMFLNTMKKMK